MNDADLETGTTPCPICGTESGLNPKYTFEQVCADCGFVVDGNKPESFLQSQGLVIEPNLATESWLEFVPIRNATEERLAIAINAIDQLGQRLSLGTQSRVRGAEIFGKLTISGDTNGRRKEQLAIAALYWGERIAEQPVPITVLSAIGEIEYSSLRDSINTVRAVLDTPTPPTTPADYVTYLSRELELSNEESHALSERLQSYEAACEGTGQNPIGIAAAAAYRLLHGRKTQAEICEVAGISTETIRIRIAELAEVEANE